MLSTSYRELWANVSLDRWAVNFMQMSYACAFNTFKLLSIFN